MKKTKKIIWIPLLLIAAMAFVQADSTAVAEEEITTDLVTVEKDTVIAKRVKLDGIAAVIGDYVILDSDVEKTLIDLKTQGASTENITHCQLLGKLMEDRLYAHQAVQDSILVSDEEVSLTGDRQLQGLVQQIGSIEKVLKYYKKEDEASFREELYKINKL